MSKTILNALSFKNRILLKELVKTDFKLRYQGSVLGHLWSILKPLMLFAIMYVVFVKFLRFGADIPHYAVALLLAITLWSFFTEATGQGMHAIINRGDLVRKISFPKYILVVSATVSALINLAINLGVVVILAMISGVEFHWHIVLLPLVLLELYIFSLAVAFLLSALYVKFRDISHIWEVVIQAAFYATPIIYPLSYVATNTAPIFAKILLLNPMAQIIQDARYLVVNGNIETVWNYIGNPLALIPLIIVVALAIIASMYFRHHSKQFAEEI